MSEHVEMYLVMIALLRDDPQSPVPLSLLAQKLAISPVSVNEMCRKLNEHGLVQYQPYKGVTLTATGEHDAQTVLHRRRLWELFLIEELDITPEEADIIACELEHITSERLISALHTYLAQAPSAVRGCPLQQASAPVIALTALALGQQARIVAIPADRTTAEFLRAQGLTTGATATLLALGDDGSALLEIDARRVMLSGGLMDQITVHVPASEAALPRAGAQCCALRDHPVDQYTHTPVNGSSALVGTPTGTRTAPILNTTTEGGTTMTVEPLPTTLGSLQVGQCATIVRVGGEKAFRRRLLDMGLVTGETVTVERVAPMGDPIEVLIKGYYLSLRKQEASQITVEVQP